MSALNLASKYKFLLQPFLIGLTLILFLLSPEIALADNISKLKELAVSYWPEYDKPSVLIIYRGKLPDNVRLPARVKLFVPKETVISSTAEVDENGQFQYDYAWPTHSVVSSFNYKELSFETRYPTFQAEVYWQTISSSPTRSFNLQLKTPVAVENLNVEIQEPLKATNFKLEPQAAEVSNDGTFNYHRYSFGSQPAEKELIFKVAYEKSTNEPSLDNQLPATSVNDVSNRSTLSLWIFIGLSLIITAIVASFFRLRYASAPLSKEKAVFCSQCGQRLEKKDKFCINCGRPVK